MEEFLSGPIFKFFVFPIGSAILGVAIKFVSRNDQYAVFKKEDIAVGLELLRTSCLMFVVLTTDRAVSLVKTNEALSEVLSNTPIDSSKAGLLQEQSEILSSSISSAGWSIALLFIGMWSVSTIVRKWGWKSETEMNTLIGIALPLALGILGLILVMVGAT